MTIDDFWIVEQYLEQKTRNKTEREMISKLLKHF